MIYMWKMNPQAKKAGWGVEELTAKQKQITVGRRLWGSCRGWRCPRARPWTNQIVTESKIGQMLCWNKLGMFDYLTFVPLVPGEEDGEWPTSWSQDDCRGSGRERPIRSSRRWCASCFFYHYHYHLFSIDILPAVLEALSQRRHHVLVVFHQGSEERGHSPPWWKYGAGHLLEYGGVLRHVVQIQKFREVVEDVEGSDV